MTGATALLLAPTFAQAAGLPQGGSVAAGSATIGTPHNGTLDINQSSNRAILDWHSFSIGQGGTVNFHQPSASSATLNRVTGSTPSSISGTINAPGTVLLVNPNGIAITKDGVINTGSFAASTLDIKNSDFMSGHYKFTGNGASAGVTNAGRIDVSDGGFAALLGGHVANDGYITARLGHVALGSGELVTLDLSGDGFLSVAVPTKDLSKLKSADGKPLVSNKGQIVADGGVVALKAATAAGFLRDAVNVPGSIQANSVGLRNGMIVLGGGAGGRVRIAGNLSARGIDNSGGGKVNVTGADIGLSGTIDVSTSGKGRHGGDVSVVADDTTDFSGLILAEGGEGGFVETSGAHVHIADTAEVSTLAKNGTAGTWLIDPQDFTIAASGGDITPTTLESELARNNVTIESSDGATAGNGDIFVNDAVSWSTGNSLTLDAHRNIEVNAGIASNGGGDVNLHADDTGTGTGTVIFNGGTISTSGVVSIFYNPTGNDNTTVNTASYTTPTDYSADVTGGGTLKSYMLINTVYDLQNVNNNLGANYALGANIDASATVGWNSSAGFVPLGTDGAGNVLNGGNGFTGSFDGLSYAISGLTIDRSSSNYVGLFGYSDNAMISDIGLLGGSVSGADNVGGLIGYGNGGEVTQAYATVTVRGGSEVGGLIGHQENGTVNQVYATGAVSGDNKVGGLVGGLAYATIQQAFASGKVTMSGGAYVGGLVGKTYYATVKQSFWDKTTTGQSDGCAGDASCNTGVTAVQSSDSSAGNYAYSQATYTAQGWTFAATASDTGDWYMIGGQTRPFGSWEYSTTITNSHQLQLMSMNPSANYTLANNIDLTEDLAPDSSGNHPGMWTAAGFVPIGTDGAGTVLNGGDGFTGTFDGGSHEITALTIVRSSAEYVGLFGYARNATIENIGLVDESVSGDANVGGLVGYIDDGLITVAYAKGTVSGGNGSYDIGGLVGENEGKITHVYAKADVSSGQDSDSVGGLVGYNNGKIVQAYATGTVSGGSGTDDIGGLVGQNDWVISDAYATGNVIGLGDSYDIGGLVGENHGLITVSYAEGSVGGGSSGSDIGGLVGYNDGDIEQVHATGDVDGGQFSVAVGGLVGENDRTITGSYAEGNITGSALVGGLVGESYGTIIDAHANGTVNGNGDSFVSALFGSSPVGTGSGVIGGLVGENLGTLSDVYAKGDVNGGANSDFVGGLVGDNGLLPVISLLASGSSLSGLFPSPSIIEHAHATGTVTGSGLVGGLAGANLGTISHSYAKTGAVTGNGQFLLSSIFGSTVSSSGIGIGSSFVGGLVGENDGTLSDVHATATVDGGADSSFVGGLVGDNGLASAVINLIDPSIGSSLPTGTINVAYATGGVTGSGLVGGLAGANFGDIGQAYATGAVNGNGDLLLSGLIGSSAPNIGSVFVGGLVGENDGTLSNVFAMGNVDGGAQSLFVGGLVGDNGLASTAVDLLATVFSSGSPGPSFSTVSGTIDVAYATGNVTGSGLVGGLAGANFGAINQAYAIGAASGNGGSALSDFVGGSSSTGSIFVGGLVGENDGTLSNVYATGSVDGGADSIYIGGLSGGNGLVSALLSAAGGPRYFRPRSAKPMR